MANKIQDLSEEELKKIAGQDSADLSSVSDEELMKVAGAGENKPVDQSGAPSAYDRVMNLPGAAVRSFAQGKGYMKGANDFKNVPKYSELYSKGAQNAIMKIPGFQKLPEEAQYQILAAGGLGPTYAGEAVDTMMNPADMAMALGGEKLAQGAGKVVDSVSANSQFQKFLKTPLKNLANEFGEAFSNTSKKGFEGFQKGSIDFLDDALHTKGKEFDAVVQDLSKQNISNPVDLGSAIQAIKGTDEAAGAADQFSRLKGIVNRVPQLKDLISKFEADPTSAKMSLAESQDLYKKIGAKISKSKLSGENLNYEDYQILRFLRNNIREAQVNSLPEELSGEFAKARQDYGMAASDYKVLRGRFNSSKRFVDTARSNFGDNPIDQAKAERMIPEVAKKIKHASMATKAKKIGTTGGLTLLGMEEFNRWKKKFGG